MEKELSTDVCCLGISRVYIVAALFAIQVDVVDAAVCADLEMLHVASEAAQDHLDKRHPCDSE